METGSYLRKNYVYPQSKCGISISKTVKTIRFLQIKIVLQTVPVGIYFIFRCGEGVIKKRTSQHVSV